ncbi:hypothetical protein RhiirB3_458348 [Rhizophagus irregularis]|nr:hypothetical protein RhiirB3_458348 [Rhizophagus irregularis]
MTIVSRSSLNEVFINHKDFKLALSEFLPFDMLFENINSYTPIIQKYLLEGIDKFIGDCKDPKEFLSIWELMNHIIALPMANIIVGEEVASHEDVFAFEIWVESNFTSSKNYDQSHKTGNQKTYQGEKNARQRL